MAPILGTLGAATIKGFRALGSAFSNFFDNFNRTTSGSLGTPSGGTGEWLATSGTWNANGTVATSATAASSYPTASVEMGTPNITVNLDVDVNNGAGAAFWVSDAQNWWGVIPWQATSVTYSQACSAYGQSGAAYVCNAYGQSGPSYFCNAQTGPNYGYTCNSQTGPNYGSTCNSQTGPNYGSTCNSQTGPNYGSTCNSQSGPNYGSTCSSYGTQFQCTTYSVGYDGLRGFYFTKCNAYADVQICTAYTQTGPSYSCAAYGPTGPFYGCAAYGQTGPFYGCAAYGPTGPFYGCAAYGQTGPFYGCSSQSGPFYSQICNTQSGPFYSSVCNAYFSQTNNNPGTRYLRLIKSVANTVTTVVDQAVAATIASIKVITSNGTITGRAYSAAGQTTQTGSDLTNTPVSPTTGTKHGIILAPGGFSQGTTVDNISIILP